MNVIKHPIAQISDPLPAVLAASAILILSPFIWHFASNLLRVVSPPKRGVTIDETRVCYLMSLARSREISDAGRTELVSLLLLRSTGVEEEQKARILNADESWLAKADQWAFGNELQLFDTDLDEILRGPRNLKHGEVN